ncbi:MULTISPECIES: hypothetical protein [Rhodopseudomonas]|nr:MULTISPECIES: hypothetical protein [Rhodopseudomonas]MDF3812111.1 hypothetical protein [Rhodopseudomonas sp. BAL398]WOK20775.1 hypothetical protein RBJ75_20780 [Rhodopseudomonas sp. BAL398]
MAATTIAAGFIALATALPANALTAQECSAKYQAAKSAGTLNGQAWNDFRKEQCGAEATAAAAPEATDTKAAEAKPKRSKSAAKQAPPPSAGPATFPSAIDPKFAKETPSRARLHTCAAQWKLNKEANTTGGLRWIQKGGGYWSECNKKLKG